MIYIVSGNIVRLIVDHPNYLAGEKQIRIHGKDEFFRTEEKYQYPPDINPLILSAHKNDHELVQLFLSRGYTIARPHSIDCQCDDCQVPSNIGSQGRRVSWAFWSCENSSMFHDLLLKFLDLFLSNSV